MTKVSQPEMDNSSLDTGLPWDRTGQHLRKFTGDESIPHICHFVYTGRICLIPNFTPKNN